MYNGSPFLLLCLLFQGTVSMFCSCICIFNFNYCNYNSTSTIVDIFMTKTTGFKYMRGIY